MSLDEMVKVAMKLHEGEYGLTNWIIVLLIGFIFIVSTVAGLVSYLMRKPEGRWGLPTVSEQFHVDKTLVVIIIGMGIMFPMFGGSLIILWLWDRVTDFNK